MHTLMNGRAILCAGEKLPQGRAADFCVHTLMNGRTMLCAQLKSWSEFPCAHLYVLSNIKVCSGYVCYLS